MLVITIRFLNGSYHATPWGRNVNEGVPEWPPSSWRLVRAIIAVWKNTLSDLKSEAVMPLLQKIASEPPDYFLPEVSVAHTRHYVPIKDAPSLIMNAFVVTGEGPVRFVWKNVVLSPEEMNLLSRILKNLHYFGRAESWCTAGASEDPSESNCDRIDDKSQTGNMDIVQVLVPNKNIRISDINGDDKSGEDLDAVTVTTQQLQNKNFIDPPGGSWVPYARPKNCFEPSNSGKVEGGQLDDVTMIRYAVVGAVRPSIRDTLRVGDLARKACMSKYGKTNNGGTSAVFSGKDASGNPLIGHRHAHYLPTYEAQNSEIDHLTIIASEKFNSLELTELLSLKRLYSHDLGGVELVFQGYGSPKDFPYVPIFKKSKKWTSATPLVLTRHTKHRGKRIIDSPEEQIRSEVKHRYNSAYELQNVAVLQSKDNIGGTNIKPFDFFRWRRHGSVGDGRTYIVQLEFSQPVSGPITLGYASHFGLGMFIPQEMGK